jgi:hypothetical protein
VTCYDQAMQVVSEAVNLKKKSKNMIGFINGESRLVEIDAKTLLDQIESAFQTFKKDQRKRNAARYVVIPHKIGISKVSEE